MPSPRNPDLNVWPAELPSGARWLPYSIEPARKYSTSLPIRPAAPHPARFARHLPHKWGSPYFPFWRLVLAAVIGAGLIGIGGGMGAAAIFGAR